MFNNAKPIVPPMKNVVGDTHAETRAEIEARNRAQQATDAAILAANAEQSQKKSPWIAILTIIFAFIALAAAGFAIYEHSENEKLKQELEKANSSYSSAQQTLEALEKENDSLTQENKSLKTQLKNLETATETAPTSDDSTSQ